MGEPRERGVNFDSTETVGVEAKAVSAVELVSILGVKVDIRLRVNTDAVLLRSVVGTGVVWFPKGADLVGVTATLVLLWNAVVVWP